MDLAAFAKMIKRPLLSELILGSSVRPCERCRQPTQWAKPRQKTKGYCPDHAVADGPGFSDALKTVLRTFPGASVEFAEPETFEPGEYGKREVRVLMRGRFREDRSTHLGRGGRPTAGRRPLRRVPAHREGVRTRRPPVLSPMRTGEEVTNLDIHPGALALVDQNYAALRERYSHWLDTAAKMYAQHHSSAIVAGSALNYLIDETPGQSTTYELLAVLLGEYGRSAATR